MSTPGHSDFVDIDVDGARYRLVVPDHTVDYIQHYVYEERTPYEAKMLQDMKGRVPRGGLVLDVGANVGNHTMYLAAVARLRVIAFEPNLHLAECIRVSARCNGVDDLVIVHADAVGSAPGRALFAEQNPENLGAQAIRLVNASAEATLNVVALDDLELDHVAAIKIDVEGMESEVIKGASRIIERDRPLLYVECQDAASFEAALELLSPMGYCYWETFNATPTHLFVDSRSVSASEQLGRLMANVGRVVYEDSSATHRLRGQLDEANRKYRDVTAALMTAKTRQDDRSLEIAQLSGLTGELQSELEEMRAEVSSASASARESATSLAITRKQLAESRYRESSLRQGLELARERTRVAESAAAHAEKRARRLARQYATSKRERGKLSQALERLASSAKEVQSANAELLAARTLLEARLAAAHDTVRDWQRERAELVARMEAAVSRNRALDEAASALTEKARIKTGEVEELARGARTLRARVESIEREAQRKDRAIQRLRARAIEAEGRAAEATSQLADLRGSVTFRAGKALLGATKSPRRLVRLPATLAHLARESKVRRTERSRGDESEVESGRAVESIRERPGPTSAYRRTRVAAIVDEFSRSALAPEFDMYELERTAIVEQLERIDPDLLFVESAWRGIGDTWHNAVSRLPAELREALAWCRAKGVPTAFWNKEDPVHFGTFLTAAAEFDHVFTTDFDCIPRYKSALGHDRVWFLPFSCQPKRNHPIAEGARKDSFIFAGAYYRRYPERTRDLDSFLEHLPNFAPVEIYDRNLGGTDEDYQFPDAYRDYIVGTLSPGEVANAYREYAMAINLNSVKQSQSMFARRVFELLASNTLCVSNYSRGLRNVFGDLVVASDDGSEVVRRLQKIGATPDGIDKLRLAGLRHVMWHHTSADRVGYLLSKTMGIVPAPKVPPIHAIALCADLPQLERTSASLMRQTVAPAAVTIVSDDEEVTHQGQIAGYEVKSTASALATPLKGQVSSGSLVAVLHHADFYGRDYFKDLSLGTRYAGGSAFTKDRHFRTTGAGLDVTGGHEYAPVGRVAFRCSLISASAVGEISVLEALRDDAETQCDGAVSLDRFNYCYGGSAAPDSLLAQVVSADVYAGIAFDDLMRQAESLSPSSSLEDSDEDVLEARELAGIMGEASRPDVQLELTSEGLRINSSLPEGKHDYVYARDTIPVERLWKPGAKGVLHVEATVGLNVQMAVVFLDSSGERIASPVKHANRNETVVVPQDSAHVRIGIRALGPGEAVIARLHTAPQHTEPTRILAQARTLIVTNNYPSYDDLYRNAFVHARVRAYQEKGHRADVFRHRANASLSFSEFEGVDVMSGGASALASLIQSKSYEAVLVHFLDESIWGVLALHVESLGIAVWVHGADIQQWWRRGYLYSDDGDRERAVVASEMRSKFWRAVMGTRAKRLRFVFVSEQFAHESVDDLGLKFDPEKHLVIHNPIDTELFSYVEKAAEQRFNVLSIRPYASRTYANDLSVAAVLELAHDPDFSNMRFHFVGDGALFEETLMPIRKFENVTVERGFLKRDQIAQLHREYGVFLVPSRMDTQGVSRDEAMSSGLVPVTNRVGAISEFVSDSCGMLADPEDAAGLAAGIRRLVHDPAAFRRMSRAAAERVRAQAGAERVIQQELSLIADIAGSDDDGT